VLFKVSFVENRSTVKRFQVRKAVENGNPSKGGAGEETDEVMK
jgi:hypothetical protein